MVFKLAFDVVKKKNALNICSETLICKLFDLFLFK